MKREHSFGIIPLKVVKGKWKIFLVRHRSGQQPWWGIPKGHGERGETPSMTAKRELYEETGLRIERLLSYKPFREEYMFQRGEETISKTVSYFPALVLGRTRLQIAEIDEGRWVTLPDALKLITFKEGREVCQKLIRSVGSKPKIQSNSL